MWCNQIFSLLSLVQEATEEQSAMYKIENIIVADSYEFASKVARTNYGNTALAIDTTLYPVSIGFTYITGNFYDTNNVLVVKNKTEQERIEQLEEITEVQQKFDIFFEEELLNTQIALTEQYETNIVLEEELLGTQLALTEQYETNIALEEELSSTKEELDSAQNEIVELQLAICELYENMA